jgi:hypothetical protein
MPLDVERVVDGSVRLEEALRRRPALEALHLFLAPSDAQTRILSTIVSTQTSRSMSVAETKALKRCAVRAQAIRNDHFWFDVLVLQQPPQKSKCCSGIASLLHDHVHHLPLIVDGAPDPHTFTSDRRDHFIEMPAR